MPRPILTAEANDIYINIGWGGDQYQDLLAEAVDIVQRRTGAQYQPLRPTNLDIC